MSEKIKEPIGGYWHQCPVCGREFFAQSCWAFKVPDKELKTRIYICSWKCLRLLQKEREKNDKRRKGKASNVVA